MPMGDLFMGVFQTGKFRLASGLVRNWKIECDEMQDSDWSTLAMMAAPLLPSFTVAIGVPTGGEKWARALNEYACEGYGCRLIVEDVWTTGGSMRAFRDSLPGSSVNTIGLVLYACAKVDSWVRPFWQVGWREW